MLTGIVPKQLPMAPATSAIRTSRHVASMSAAGTRSVLVGYYPMVVGTLPAQSDKTLNIVRTGVKQGLFKQCSRDRSMTDVSAPVSC